MEDYDRLRCLRVAIEGDVGVGKTTLLRALCASMRRAGLDVLPHEERVPPERLTMYLADKARNASVFETLMLDDREAVARECASAVRELAATPVLDRSILGGAAFFQMNVDAGFISGGARVCYETRVRNIWRTRRTWLPDVVVHLRAPLDTVKERIRRRNRAGEVDAYLRVDPTYIDRLSANYDAVMDTYTMRNYPGALAAADTMTGTAAAMPVRVVVDWTSPPSEAALQPPAEGGTNVYMDALVASIVRGDGMWSPEGVSSDALRASDGSSSDESVSEGCRIQN